MSKYKKCRLCYDQEVPTDVYSIESVDGEDMGEIAICDDCLVYILSGGLVEIDGKKLRPNENFRNYLSN